MSGKHLLVAAFLVGAQVLLRAQPVDVVVDEPDPLNKVVEVVSLRELREHLTAVPGIGGEVPGMDLMAECDPVHASLDAALNASRQLVDSGWVKVTGTDTDSLRSAQGVHWVRLHLIARPELKDAPLLLRVASGVPFEVFVNGVRSGGAYGAPLRVGNTLLPGSDSLPVVEVPVRFAADGQEEVIALRLLGAPGSSLRRSGLRATLHAADLAYAVQRTTFHYGIFIGINAIILVLSLLIWSDDKRDRGWGLLALLSLASVLATVAEVGGEQRLLGLQDGTAAAFDALATVLVPWPLFLLIMVLRHLRGELPERVARRFTWMVVAMTLSLLAFVVGVQAGLASTEDGLTFTDTSIALVVGALLGGLVMAFGMGWFTIEVVRSGIRLLRSGGTERWVGAGAVASLLLTLLLQVVSEFTGMAVSGWLSTLADYCAYVAVPVSVAVYLGIRSAHHNRLVARQRDELDAEVKERTAELRTEKERSDALLLNILPAEVAEELKAKGAADAKHFDQATVLFTDFRGFTQLSEQVGPAELVQELNACFKAFDAIMGKYRIEKIKTIGDSYMAAGGLPDPTHGGPAEVVHAALEMQDFMRQHKAERVAAGKPFFEMRVGIHTGPVVAGIVGVKKFQYDIWGDTVNTASRMESSGEIGKVNISEATYALVKDAVVGSPLSVVGRGDGSLPSDNRRPTTAFSFTPRGKVQAKGKGEMEMYFVQRSSDGA
ncbi:MAG: hypothetical protein JNJ64_09045 [Flavobacteriales bacterium]|nr:hypothetical protein [Flavobacteriales bacterium]